MPSEFWLLYLTGVPWNAILCTRPHPHLYLYNMFHLLATANHRNIYLSNWHKIQIQKTYYSLSCYTNIESSSNTLENQASLPFKPNLTNYVGKKLSFFGCYTRSLIVVQVKFKFAEKLIYFTELVSHRIPLQKKW